MIVQPITNDGLLCIKREADVICSAISQQYFSKRPEYLKGDVDRIKQRCKSDFHHHLGFLLTAMTTASSKVFSDYAIWLRNVLEKRNMTTEHPLESFTLIKEEFLARVQPIDYPIVIAVLDAGISALKSNSFNATELGKTTCTHPTDFSQAISQGARAEAEEIVVNAIKNGTSLTSASVEIIQPAMYTIGNMWENNKITVAQEHLATAISQNILAKAYALADFASPLDKQVICACIEGNHHCLGLRMISDAFETCGWDSTFLGVDTPNYAIISQVDLEKPDVLALSLSMPEQLLNLNNLHDMLRTHFGAKCPNIIIGGLVINQHQAMLHNLSIDGYFNDAKQLYRDLKS